MTLTRMIYSDNLLSQDKIGIYKIENLVNGKVYVGKTVNFRSRYNTYNSAFRTNRTTHINRYLMSSLSKYGISNFKFSKLESCSLSETGDRELFWMDQLDSCSRNAGYNLRRDSSTGMETHEDTRAHLSSKIIQQYADGKRDKRKISEFFKGFWSNPVVKDEMAKRVAEVNRSYFIQRDKTTSDIVCVWDGINQIKAANPQWKWQNIYAACNGSKPSYLGFKWERSSEIPEGCEHLVHRGENVLFKDVDKTHLPRTNSLVYTVHHGEFKGEYTGVELSKIYAAMYNAFCKAKCNEIYWKRGKTKITRG